MPVEDAAELLLLGRVVAHADVISSTLPLGPVYSAVLYGDMLFDESRPEGGYGGEYLAHRLGSVVS
jgi:hypothetical protein